MQADVADLVPVVEAQTGSAQAALASAEVLALGDGSGAVCAHHLLLALAGQPDSVAGRILAEQGYTPESLAEQMKFIAADASPDGDPGGALARSPRLQRMLELAAREAGRRGADATGTRDLLAALTRSRDGIGAFLLAAPGSGYRRLDEALKSAAKDGLADPS